MANLLDRTTQLWVKITGKLIDPKTDDWLLGPIGDEDLIADKFISNLAKENGYEIVRNEAGSGLFERIEQFDLTEAELDRLSNKVKDFYEHTFNYEFEVWSEWKGIFRPFGWLLSVLFSKRLQQLNLPLSPMDSAKGLESNIIKLKKNGEPVWTIWFRTLKANNEVIYSGVYTTCHPPKYSKRLVKVVFPLPNGNASVVMNKEIEEDGSLLLSSDGRAFGDNGFYFLLTDRAGKYWAKYVRAMHEWIRVFEDAEGTLRADHNLNFYGFRFLNLHYKMRLKN